MSWSAHAMRRSRASLLTADASSGGNVVRNAAGATVSDARVAFISLIHSRRHISLTTLSRPRIAISGADILDRRRTYHESFIRPARDRAARDRVARRARPRGEDCERSL